MERCKGISEEYAENVFIPVSGKHMQSMGIVSFDPKGTFRLTDNRYIRVFNVCSCKDLYDEFNERIADDIKGRVRITSEIDSQGENKLYITLMEEGISYEEVQKDMSEDQEALCRIFTLKPMSVDEVMMKIDERKGEGCKPFSYASMVRAKKDWMEECLPSIKEDTDKFYVGELYGESMFVKEYPSIISINQLARLRDIGCSLYICLDFKHVCDITGINQAIEQKYNRRLSENNTKSLVNTSMSIMFVCDSEDARIIVEKTLRSILGGAGYIISSCYGSQKNAALSIMSFGLLDYTVMRNVLCRDLNKLMGEILYGGNKDKV